MKLSRLLLPLLLAFSVLFVQQVEAAHVLRHTLAEQQQQNKHGPQQPACEKCATYAQLGSALSNFAFDFTPPQLPEATVQYIAPCFRSAHTLTAVARGPPASVA